MEGSVLAVVVAGGSGSRLSGEMPKQFMEVARRPLMVHAIAPFQTHPSVAEITVVLPEDADPEWRVRLHDRFGLNKVVRTVTGGTRRMDSVRRGVEAALAGGEWPEDVLIAVHDAARPMLEAGLLDRLLEAAADTGAAVPVIDVADTVAVDDGRGWWEGFVPRTDLRLVQTPQVFRADWLLEAHQRGEDLEASDDAQLVHALGHPVRLVAGDPRNMKVTTAADLEEVRMHLERGGR